MLRFGKTIPLPSIFQIKHELRLMMATETFVTEVRAALEGVVLSAKQVSELAAELGSKHGISSEGAQALANLVAVRRPRRMTSRAV